MVQVEQADYSKYIEHIKREQESAANEVDLKMQAIN